MRPDPFPAIGAYGVIGNLETVALVSASGAIEYLPYPHFDSATLFAAMLDRDAGRLAVTSDIAEDGTQHYHRDTNILVTRFEAGGRALEITDFMPVGAPSRANQLVRIVACVAGEAQVDVACAPRFDYARGRTTAGLREDGAAVFEGEGGLWPVRLLADRQLEVEGATARLSTTLAEGERLVLNLVCDNAESDLLSDGEIDAALEDTAGFWREWADEATYDGRWRDAVIRSALALKLMVSDTHGSLVAAPTFGLPETIGGVRNWDYRYCWIRDASFTIYAFLRLGLSLEAQKYCDWISERLATCDDTVDLKLMYRLDGSQCLAEQELPHLTGYRGSSPVRIGNAAADQTQLDIYGELVDALYLAHKRLGEPSEESLGQLSRIVETVCANWRCRGSGFWEMRGEPQEFLDARVLSWVAVDRAIRLAGKTRLEAPARWHDTRAQIAQSIHGDFWNEDVGAFTQTKGSEHVDSVALLMPLLKFCPATDPRFCSTLAVIEDRLADGCLVRRYETPREEMEGLAGDPEGYFVACSFWRIECLARCGRGEEARRHMDDLLALASPLGLMSEEIAADGTHLGNTPQALSHLALISAAVAVNRALDTGGEPF